MAKLTRTQKYADLRNELANDKEATNTSQDLSSYADRFNNVQNTLAPEAPKMPTTEPEYTYKPEKETSQSSYFDSFMNAPTQEVKDDFSSFFKSENANELGTDDFYKEVFNDVNDVTDNTISRQERNTYLNQTISDVNFHNIVNGETTLNQIVDNAVNEVRHTEDIKPVYNEPEAEDNIYSFDQVSVQNNLLDADAIVNDDVFSNTVSMEITKIMDEMNKTTEEIKQVVNEPVSQPALVVQETKIETPVVNEFVQEPISTAQQTPVDTPVYNTVIEEPIPVVNTVFEEVKVEPIQTNEFIQEPTPLTNSFIEEVKAEIATTNEFIQEPVTETPVVNTVIEEPAPVTNTVAIEKPEDVVEIKNIKEMAEEPIRNTISGTIPFVVATEDEDDIEDEDETEGSNVVLNVILIVLIIVLMAVLGLIVFYILKTKGIL